MAHRDGLKSMVITFDRHPRQVVHADYVPQLITPLNEKLRLLNLTGADRIEVLHFDTNMAALSAHDFMLEVLHRQLGVGTLLIGYDNRFGHNRAEDFDDYVRYGHDMGINVVQNTPIDVEGMRVSSSLVRRLLAEGDVSAAATCLGRRFEIEGTVEHGIVPRGAMPHTEMPGRFSPDHSACRLFSKRPTVCRYLVLHVILYVA